MFDKTPINIYGQRGDLVYYDGEKLPAGVKQPFYRFESFDNRLKITFPKFINSFYICQPDLPNSK